MSGESENYLGVRKRFTSGRSVSWIGIGEDFEDLDGDVVTVVVAVVEQWEHLWG